MTSLRTVGQGAVRRWDRFWFTEVDGLPLGAVRIGIAVTGVVLWSGMAPQIRHFYSNAGEWPIEGARWWSSEWVARFLMPDALGAFPVAAILFAVWGAAVLALLVGWRTRGAAVLNWLLTVWFLQRNPTFNNGGDEVYRLVSFYLVLAFLVVPPAHRALSLDRKRAVGAWDGPTTVPVWTLRMVQIQVAVVYLVSGFWKVVGPPWWDGTALWIALANPSFSRFGAPDGAWLRLPFTVATIAIAWWELLFGALVASSRTRLPALAFGVCLHLGILVFMSIGIFPFAMLGCYPAFLSAAQLRRFADRISGGAARQPRADSSASAASAVVP